MRTHDVRLSLLFLACTAAPQPATPTKSITAMAVVSAAPSVAPYEGPISPALRNTALHSPMPRGWIGGWYGDTGVDIAGDHLDVFAIADGTLDYSEYGHTLWRSGKDTAFSVRIALDQPIAWKGHTITHAYYTHMSKLETTQAEGARERKHVRGGERIGISGIGNGVPHLHLGLLLDNDVSQTTWATILREDDIRKLMGDYRNGELLPAISPPGS